MNEPPPTSKLSFPHMLFIVIVALVTFYFGFSPIGDIGIHFNFNKYTYWYYNGLAPCIQSLIATLTGGLTARGHYLGGWVAGGAVLAIFGGMYVLFQDIDPTDRPLQSLVFMILGITVGIFVLYAWYSLSKRKLN
jgi:hypothetical protein